MNDLTLNNMTLIISIDINTNLSIKTHVTYDKPVIFLFFIFIFYGKEV
jgi:hypothetical protein